MRVDWFGWLTKGHYQISMLDRLIGLGEFVAALAVFVAVAAMFDWIRKRRC